MDELLREERVASRFDQRRWGNIFIPGLGLYFQTLRDVYRFISTLSFHISLFRNKGTFEVNPVDLIALEVLRVFEPQVYRRIPTAKSALTKLKPTTELYGEAAIEAVRREAMSIVESASEGSRPRVQEILKQLFPPAEWVFGGSSYSSGFEEEWFRDLRICHPNVFDRYFHLAIPEGDISQAELDTILSLAGRRDLLVTQFRSLNERGLFGVALDRLEAYKQKIDLRHAVPFITALLDVGDELPEEQGGVAAIGPDMHAIRIIRWYLMQQENPKERGRILKDSVRATEGLYLAVQKVSIEGDIKEREKKPDAFLVDKDDLEQLQEICVKKIRRAAEDGTLSSKPQLDYILYRWREWASPDEPSKWVSELVESTDGILSFLTGFLHRSISQGLSDHVGRIHWRVDLQSIEAFIPADFLEGKVKQLDAENLEEKQKTAVLAFLKAIKRRREGKSDNSFWPDQDD